MRIGVPTEIKSHEYRVGMTPSGVRELTRAGHPVVVQTGAGSGAGIADAEYAAAGATLEPDVEALFSGSDLIVKVKEPQPVECARLREGQVLFTFLHLAADPAQARGLLKSGATAIAYETVTAPDGSLPLLTPMSEVAGRMSIQVGAHCLERAAGGRGVLLGGVPGTLPARVVVIGGGIAGSHAAEMAIGFGADVTIVDRALPRLRELAARFEGRAKTVYSTRDAIGELVTRADLVVGTVLVPGAATPKLVDRAMVRAMPNGSVVVDVAIDQGGCFETSRPTTHAEPTYVEEGVVHYCVTNMPGAVPRTSTFALTNATLPFVRRIAMMGVDSALEREPGLSTGLTVRRGEIVHPIVAEALGFSR
ncbi:MAG: alanine dehydrogenase [Deltaproteobacteria bacterium]|nr:alanine dehydrogenase [Deltaproteobacteria bacterium]